MPQVPTKAKKRYKYDLAKTPLRNARESRGMTAKEVADICEIDPGNLSRIERQRQKASTETAEALAALFRDQGLTETHVLYPDRFMKKS